MVAQQGRSSLLVPFHEAGPERKLLVSRLRGRAVQAMRPVTQLSLGRFRFSERSFMRRRRSPSVG
jgi:hypothetical protein